MNKIFIHDQLIRFSHCDPAGIVYFPRFFDLAHGTMEDWFADGLGQPLPDLIRDRRIGTPTVTIQSDFVSRSEWGTPCASSCACSGSATRPCNSPTAGRRAAWST